MLIKRYNPYRLIRFQYGVVGLWTVERDHRTHVTPRLFVAVHRLVIDLACYRTFQAPPERQTIPLYSRGHSVASSGPAFPQRSCQSHSHGRRTQLFFPCKWTPKLNHTIWRYTQCCNSEFTLSPDLLPPTISFSGQWTCMEGAATKWNPPKQNTYLHMEPILPTRHHSCCRMTRTFYNLNFRVPYTFSNMMRYNPFNATFMLSRMGVTNNNITYNCLCLLP